MKQAILFLAILAAGLAVLIVMLGGTDDLLLEYEKPVIEAQEVEDVSKVFGVSGGRGRLEVAMPSAWEGPVTKEHVIVDENGLRRRVPSSRLVMPETQRFDEGVLSRNPELSLFRKDGSVSATLHGDLGTLFASGIGADALTDTEGLQAESFHVSENVVGRVFDEQGQVLLELLTESLQVPFPDRNAAEDEMPPLNCPAPVTLRRPDGSLVIHARSAELDTTRRTLVLHGPVDVESLALSLQPETDPGVEQAVAEEPEPPLTVRSNGDLVYRWQERARSPEDSEPLRRLDDGQLTLTRDVRIVRGDLWVEAQFVDTYIKRRTKRQGGGFRLKTLKALGHDGGPVHFGMFEGAGTCTELFLEPGEHLLRMEGPVLIEGIRLERPGREPLVVQQLAARRQARLTGEPEPIPDSGPRRWSLRLREEAALLVPGLVEARADALDLEVLELGTAESAESPPASDRMPANVELDGLTLTRNASLVFHLERERSGTGRGDRIEVDLEETGEQLVTLTGAATLDLVGAEDGPLEAAHLTGPEIVLRLPEDPDATVSLTVESLTTAWFDLRGSTPLDPTTPDGTATDTSPARLTVEPQGPCRLVASSTSLDFTGRAVYWVRRGEEPPRRLVCDTLTLEGLDQPRPTVTARGDIEINDPAQGLLVHAESLELGEDWMAHGAPAYAEVALEDGGLAKVWAEELQMNPATRFLRAENRQGRARITAPETLTAGMLPASGDRVSDEAMAVPDPDGATETGMVELLARRIILEPVVDEPRDDSGEGGGAEGAAQGPRLARLLAHDDVQLTRDSDGTHASGQDLVVSLVERSVRLDGGDGGQAVLRRPVPGQPDRWERVDAAWMEFQNSGDDGAIAPGAVFVFFVASADTDDDAATRRIELVTDGVTVLEGVEVRTSGGVRATIQDGLDTFLARAERLTVTLSAPFPKGGIPRRILAQRQVYLEHPMFTCTGSLLVHDLANEMFELKAGLEPCRVLSSSAAMPFPVRSRFHLLKARVLFGREGLPLDDIQIEGLYAEPVKAATTVEAVRQ